MILKIVPQGEGGNAYLDINGMSSESNDQIHSCEVKIGNINLTGDEANKAKLNNLDAWAIDKGDN